MSNCSKCGKKLGWLSLKEMVDGKEFCPECAQTYRQEKARKKREKEKQRGRRKRQEDKKLLEQRIRPFKRQIASEPHNPIPYFELAQFLYKQTDLPSPGYYEDVLRESIAGLWENYYTKALALGLPSAVQRGVAHHALGCWCSEYGMKHKDAARGYVDPPQFHRVGDDLVDQKGVLKSWRERMGDKGIYHLEEAAREFRSYLKSVPDDVETMYWLAHVLQVLGKNKERGKLLVWAKETEARHGMGLLSPQLGGEPRTSKDKGISFEDKCLVLLKTMGFTCRTTAVTGDGGIDIVATSNQPFIKGTYIVQCKDWKNPVGEPPVRDLYGVVASEKANKGILITSSTFTQAAQDFVQGKNIELIDGNQLETLIETHTRKKASSLDGDKSKASDDEELCT